MSPQKIKIIGLLLTAVLTTMLTACTSSKKNKQQKAIEENQQLLQETEDELALLKASENASDLDTTDADDNSLATQDDLGFEASASVDDGLLDESLNLDEASTAVEPSAQSSNEHSPNQQPDTPKEKTWVPVKKIATQTFKKQGVLINAVYIARLNDTPQTIAQKIGLTQADDIIKLNPHLKSMVVRTGGRVKVGTKVYYNSPRRPRDQSRVVFFYNDMGLAPTQYILKQGKNIRTESKKLLGHHNSWHEIWATHPEIQSKWVLQRDYNIVYWPEGVVQNIATHQQPEPPQTETHPAPPSQEPTAQEPTVQEPTAQAPQVEEVPPQAVAAQPETHQTPTAQVSQTEDAAPQPAAPQPVPAQAEVSQTETKPQPLEQLQAAADIAAEQNKQPEAQADADAEATPTAATAADNTAQKAADTLAKDVSTEAAAAAQDDAETSLETFKDAALNTAFANAQTDSILKNLPSLWKRFQSRGVQGLHTNERNALFLILTAFIVGLTLAMLLVMWWRRRRVKRFQKAAHN